MNKYQAKAAEIMKAESIKRATTLRLIGVGVVPGVKASELNVGDVVLHSFGERSKVSEIVSSTEKMMTIKLESLKTGEMMDRTLNKNKLVARVSK